MSQRGATITVMPKRRADYGTGSVRWHRNGWELTLWADGRRIVRRHKGPNTRQGEAEAGRALDQLRARMALGVDGMTLGRLIDAYVAHKESGWSPGSARQVPATRAALLAHLGDVPVDGLRLRDIEAAYSTMLAEGAAVGTVRRRHGFLRAALQHAVRWEVIASNPAAAARVEGDPVQRAGEDLPPMVDVWSALARIDHERMRIVAVLAAATGARRGEIAYLRWRDIDLTTGVVRFHGNLVVVKGGLVRRPTKTKKPKVLTIDAVTLDEVKRWRTTCRRAALELGVAIDGDAPVVPSPSDPLEPWHPEQMTRRWAVWRRHIGLGDHVRLHDLRHLQATHLLGEGISPAAGAARLGQASTKTFLDVYSHARRADDQAAADVVERARRQAT